MFNNLFCRFWQVINLVKKDQHSLMCVGTGFDIHVLYRALKLKRRRQRNSKLRKKRSTQLIRECWSFLTKLMTCQNLQNKLLNITWHYLPTYQIFMISNNVEFLPPIFMPCFGSHFENGRHLQCGKPYFSNTRQNGEWTEISTRQLMQIK
jgi:hypothetical protein